MTPVIYVLAKICKGKEHAQDFRAGMLYMNPLCRFIKKNCDGDSLRNDPDENCVARFQPGKIILSIGGHTIPNSDLVGPIKIGFNYLSNYHVFCLVSVDSRAFDSITRETLSEFKRSLEIHKNCFSLGNYCVVIINVQEFINRVSSAIRREKLEGKMGPVLYYDEATFHGYFDEEKFGFLKRSCYSHQREYRILIECESPSEKPLILNVGDLSDISILTTPEEFNRTLQIKLPE